MTLSATLPERTLAPMDSAMVDYLNADRRERRAMVAAARREYRAFRIVRYGFTSSAAVLTAPSAQAKLSKSTAPTFGLSLTPARTLMGMGAVNLCPAATAGCEAACLNTAGKGRLSEVQRARQARAAFLMHDPLSFGVILAAELCSALGKHGQILARLNVISDIRWELVIPRAMVTLQGMGVGFYDYTKWAPKSRAPMAGYALTFSVSERMSDADAVALADAGHNVAIVFAMGKRAAVAMVDSGATWNGLALVDGISTDDRTLDPRGGRGAVVVLAALGDALGDASGFVRPATFAA